MLQINTGKLYQAGVGRTNHLRGVLFSNLRLPRDEPIVTAAGTLTGTDAFGDNRALIYEIDEHIEQTPDGPGVLISHGITPFLSDFAALTSFAFNAIASPDGALIDRLLSGKPGLASYDPPKAFVKRALDERVWVQEAEAEAFTRLVDELLGLDRRHFNAAMRAIRTYVSAVQRLPDDLGVAYTLMVSAIESLAQDFDGYTTAWVDVDERKRGPIDAALRRAAASTAAGVRAAITSVEHASLARRYRAFVKSHVGPDYYRDPTLADTRALAACELDEALRQAYAVRSRYLHNLRVLPDPLTHPFNHWEVAYVERHAVLTFQGLARLTRYVIRSFIRRGPKVASENYDYRREEAGIVTAELAPQYWIHHPLRREAEASRRLEGFLEQLASAFMRQPDAAITDIREMLHDVERLAPKASAKTRALCSHSTGYSIALPETSACHASGRLSTSMKRWFRAPPSKR